MKKYIKILIMTLTMSLFAFNILYAAGSSGGDGYDKIGLYKKGKKLVLRAKKQEDASNHLKIFVSMYVWPIKKFSSPTKKSQTLDMDASEG